MGAEEIIREKALSLSIEKQAEVIDFIEFLIQKESKNITRHQSETFDPILALEGLGSEIWQGVDSDQYVQDLRKEWT